MYKKRGDAVRLGNKAQIVGRCPPNKSGQITIFIIVGLLILFAFFFTLQLTNKIKGSQLEEAKEQIISKNFQKEALRIFVQDCLTDELENGLILVGKQGRLWSDQPGGTKVFEEGVTGSNYNPGETGGRVFYAITDERYPAEGNSFPCGNESNSPEFCQYKYPDTQVGFGNLELRPSTLQNDLRRFLINRTTWCVENFTRTNISSEAVVETETISLKMDILDDGINVEVDYPLKLILGNEEFFHLSKFDFFYPTQFKALLDSALALPTRMDWKYVDFNYTKETMEGTYFTHGSKTETRDCSKSGNFFLCNLTLLYGKYSSIGVEMKNQTLPNGDDLFIFEAAPYSVLNSPEKFEYRFLRQNRPPALDYVSRLECPQAGYDYLVIKNNPTEMGEIDITLNAKDADEDNFNYGFELWNGAEIPKDSFKIDTKDQNVNLPKGYYNVTAYVIDEHGKQDWQNVRVLVDREAELGISLRVPYKFKPSSDSPEQNLKSYEDKFAGNYYYVSNEDPIFVNLIYPSDSLADLSKMTVRFNYSNEEKSESFESFLPTSTAATQNCFSFPWLLSKDCDLEDYASLIEDWKKELSSRENSYFQQPTTMGKLTVSFSTEYCAAFGDSGSAEAEIAVKDCLPNVNPEHPFAYPYEGYKYEQNENGEYVWTRETGAEINPFLATHSCCSGVASNPGSWELKGEGEVCFRNPQPGCYGKVLDDNGNPWTSLSPGYVLEQEVDTCDGVRGNVCGDPDKDTKKAELWQDKLVCGDSSFPDCSEEINDKCKNKPSWSIVEGEGWCHGEMGCTSFCQAPGEIVYDGVGSVPSDINLEAKMQSPKPTWDSGTDFHCGCMVGEDEDKSCDSNFNGFFGGTCAGDTNECVGDS